MLDRRPVPDCRRNPGVAAGSLERKGDAEWTTDVHAPLHDPAGHYPRQPGPSPVVHDDARTADNMRPFSPALGSLGVFHDGPEGLSLVLRHRCFSRGYLLR